MSIHIYLHAHTNGERNREDEREVGERNSEKVRLGYNRKMIL